MGNIASVGRVPSCINSPQLDVAASSASRKAAWKKWEVAALGSGEHRDLAIAKLEDCWERKAKDLNLEHLSLTELPPHLPDWLTDLNVAYNEIAAFPADFCPNLERLAAHHNPALNLLSTQPLRVLRQLNASDCNITELSGASFPFLEELDISRNPELVTLSSELPSSLLRLNAACCALRRLPELPNALQYLDVRHNRITDIVSVRWPDTLLEINFSYNGLTTFPISLLSLPKPGCRIIMEENPLSEATRRQLHQLKRASALASIRVSDRTFFREVAANRLRALLPLDDRVAIPEREADPDKNRIYNGPKLQY